MGDVKIMRLRYDGKCACGVTVGKGERAGWNREARQVICMECLESGADLPDPVALDAGIPGASLDREYARRKALRAARVTRRFPRAGGLLLKLAGPVQTTEAFAIGAEGEREVALLLEKQLGDTAMMLYNRRRGTGRERGDIDILAVTSAGVFIIDPKKYVGKKVRVKRGTFVVDGRKRPQLAASMRRQVDAVSSAMAVNEFASVPVGAAYCFLGADLPWHTLRVDGVAALGRRGVVKMLKVPGPLDVDARRRVHSHLAACFPPA